MEMGEFAKAEAMFRETLALRRKFLDPMHPDIVAAFVKLVGALKRQAKDLEIEAILREAQAERRNFLENESMPARSLRVRAQELRHQGKYAEAEANLREGMAIAAKMYAQKGWSERTVGTLQWFEDIATVRFEAGDLAEAKRLAQEWLKAKDDTLKFNYGNVVHNAHALLGRIALREGDKTAACDHLIQAGRTPGSPQLDSYGPDFALAGEVLATGARAVVLEYLDLVRKFYVDSWATSTGFAINDPYAGEAVYRAHADKWNQWKKTLAAGQTPDDWQK